MWDERFSEPGFAYGTEPNDFLVEVCARIPRGPVLCLGEGEGRNAVYLASQGYEVTAVDSSAVGLRKARGLAEERGVAITTVHADLHDYVIERGGWAGIVEIFCQLYPRLRVRVHRGVVAGLRPDGVFALESYAPAQLGRDTGGPPVRERLYALQELREELEGLSFERALETEREILEGPHHTGLGAVVQLLAVKP